MDKEMTNKNSNKCPVCGEEVKQDESIMYCVSCGFNIPTKINHKKPNAC